MDRNKKSPGQITIKDKNADNEDWMIFGWLILGIILIIALINYIKLYINDTVEKKIKELEEILKKEKDEKNS